MNYQYPLNDPLNLRGFIDIITDHVRTNGVADAQPRTLSGFLEALLRNISFHGRAAKEWSDSLLKILSGNLHYIKAEALAAEINSGRLDSQLISNTQAMADTINAAPHAEDLFLRIQKQVSKRFFSDSEISALSQRLEKGEDAAFLLTLVKHGFASLYNLPFFFAERIYDEALTYDYDSPLRFSLMREAARNGNRSAALEYGNYLAKSRQPTGTPYEEAFEYMLMAAPLPAAVWNMAYLIQKQWVGDKQIRQFKSELKIEEKIGKSKEFIPFIEELEHLECNNNDSVLAEAYITSYKAYFFLAYRGFFKAFNSLSILLENEMISFSGPGGKEKAKSLRDKYSRAAIAGGNVTAASNEGNRLRRDREQKHLFDPSAKEEQYLRELLTIAADAGLMHACFYLGNYYEFAASQGADHKSFKTIHRIYERAEELDLKGDGIHGQLFFRMAKLETDIDKKMQYYEKAIDHAEKDDLTFKAEAAYFLAACCCEKFGSDLENQHLIKAQNLLDDWSKYLSEEYREKAKTLQSYISEKLPKK